MIVTNCPAREDIPEFEYDTSIERYVVIGIDTKDYCVKHKKQCKNVVACVVKNIIKGNGKFEVENDKE